MGKFVKGDIVVAPFPFSEKAFQFLLATAIHEAGKFELLNVAETDGR